MVDSTSSSSSSWESSSSFSGSEHGDAGSSTTASASSFEQEDEESLSTIVSVVKALIIGGLLIAIFYYHLNGNSDENNTQQQQLVQEDEAERRRKRLERLDNQQQRKQQLQDSTTDSGGTKTTVPAPSLAAAGTETSQATTIEAKSAEAPSTRDLSPQSLPQPKQAIQDSNYDDDEEEDDENMQILRLKRPSSLPDGEEEKKNQNSQQQQSAARRVAAAAAAAERATKKTKKGEDDADGTLDFSDRAAKDGKSRLKSPPPQSRPSTTASTTTNDEDSKPKPKVAPPSSVVPASDSKKKKNNSSNLLMKKSPQDILLQTLSSITGMTVTTTAAMATTKKEKTTTVVVQLPDSALPSATTWKDILATSSSSPSFSAQHVFEPLQSHLCSIVNTNKKNHHLYGPIKLTDRRLYKASDWYQKSKTWFRDHFSATNTANDGHAGGVDEPKEGLQHFLEEFQKWIIQTIVLQIQTDVLQLPQQQPGKDAGSVNDDDDDDVDMGLFADEYGGGSVSATTTTTPHAPAETSTTTKDDDDKTLLGELLFLLADPTDGPKVLTKPFLAQLVQSYDNVIGASASSSLSSLGTVLLQQCLQRLPSPQQKMKLNWDKTQKHITALTNLLTLSPDATKALADTMNMTATTTSTTEGKTWEDESVLRSLFCLAAWTVPRFNNNTSATNYYDQQQHQRNNYDELLPQSFHANLIDSMRYEYPVALYSRQGGGSYDDALRNYHGVVKHSRCIYKSSRTAGALALKKIAASSSSAATTAPSNQQSEQQQQLRKGGLLFDWIGSILETNEPLVDMIQSDLLSPSSAQALCCSRPFLLGVTTSLLQMCTTNLSSRLIKEGSEAFDYQYFLKELDQQPQDKNTTTNKQVGLVIPSHERCLIDVSSSSMTTTNDPSRRRHPVRFPGATEFFFLTAGLLRISLFVGFRVDEEFRSMQRHVFASIQQLAARQPTKEQLRALSSAAGGRSRGRGGGQVEQLQKCSSIGQGWQIFIDDPDISPMLTAFSLLQLQWVSLVLTATNSAAASIPEWFVKLPSQWLAHVAIVTPHLLQPQQGIDAVEYATRILKAGTTSTAMASSPSAASPQFSPPVLCQLIRIAGAFVREGVRRARQREQSKSHNHHLRRRRGGRHLQQQPQNAQDDDEDFEQDIIDDRTLDIYHSFDARDLGITVFTNEFVAKHLCPTLFRAYRAMDAAEGMDVEREHHFEKFEVKHEVADLILRLWCHPNGQSRQAIVDTLENVGGVQGMNEFCSSVAGALGFQLDQSCQFILDVRDIKVAHESSPESMLARTQGREPPRLSPRDAAAIDHHAKFLSFSLQQCRRLLLILCYFSKEEKIAELLGGKTGTAASLSSSQSAAPDLANMFLNLMERLTDEDGGIHPELEARQLKPGERSAVMLSHLGSIAPDKLQETLRYLLHSRRFALLEYGLDVSLLVHQFLALAAQWHLAAVSIDKEGKRTSVFLRALVASDICDSKRLRNVFRRLVGEPKEMSGTEVDNAAYILERDGHVDLTIWKEQYKFEGTGPDKGKGRKRQAKQDRMSHTKLEGLVALKDIEIFLNDLEEAEASRNTFAVAARWGTIDMQNLEARFLAEGDLLQDEDYTESLKEWVVSSDSFLCSSGNGSFAHSYDSLVRGRGAGAMGAGKILAKEARKCFKLIPQPHPNTSVFVCFAEERTDLCKAIIIGAADTPFSMGMFEFDILFPSNYPQSPPLFNFKTTGDGRTRISSNLYNDGKVCISILGTYQAFDDSQRWNPQSSSLAQVLASLQTQLLGDAEPYFSDGFNHDSVRGTPAGDRGSERFNNKIRLHTLRYAIIAPLKHHPLGFEEVTKRHFALCRKRVLAQARLWTAQSEGTPLYASFVRAYEELITLLSSDDLVHHEAPGRETMNTDDSKKAPWGSVPLHTADFRALEDSDGNFVQLHLGALRVCLARDAQPRHSPAVVAAAPPAPAAPAPAAPAVGLGLQQAAPQPTSNQIAVGFNPWATGAASAASEAPINSDNNTNATDGDGDDFDDMYG